MAVMGGSERLSSPEFGPYVEFYYAILENENTLDYTVTKILCLVKPDFRF